MPDILSRLNPAEIPVLIGLTLLAVVVGVIGVARVISVSLRRYRERKLAASMVLRMLDRRMPFSQIRDVLAAMDLDDDLDRVCALRHDAEEDSLEPDPPDGEATYTIPLPMASPLPSRLSTRNAMWIPQDVAV